MTSLSSALSRSAPLHRATDVIGGYQALALASPQLCRATADSPA